MARMIDFRFRMYLFVFFLKFFLVYGSFPLEKTNVSLRSTMVLYTHSATDPEYTRNLEYFIEVGMHEEDGCDFFIILQGVGNKNNSKLPKLPAHAHYLYHENVCFDWGTFGWAIFSLKLQIQKYTHFIFMNSSVRGPFMPPIWPDKVHWSSVFKSKINKKVKLVGSTISCEPVRENGNPYGILRHNAHVQSYAMATDRVGLQVLLNDKHVFQCHKSIADAVYHAEVGASLAIFKAGFTIDSFMYRYQGVDWTNKKNWDCNGRLNPYAEFAYDGISLNPLEVIFVKVKSFQRETEWVSTVMATQYDRWRASKGKPGAIVSNQYQVSPMRFRMGRILQMQLRGKTCFDFEFYRKHSPDIPTSQTDKQLWEEFVAKEQFLGRRFRFLCDSPFLKDPAVLKIVQWQAEKIKKETVFKRNIQSGRP